MRKLLLTLLAAAVAAPAATMLIRDARIYTMGPEGVLERGSILIEDGKIAAVGASLEAPAGAEILEGDGLVVTPGVIDCHSHLAADAINESGVPVTAMVSMVDVLDPTDIGIYRAVAGGVTAANILHGSANPIGGQTVVVKLRWGKTAEEMIFEGALPGIKFALGENPKRASKPIHPNTRQGVNDVIKDAFLRARAYQAARNDYEAAQSSGKRMLPPRRDLELEALAEVLEGERLVHAHCYRADEILALLRVADEVGFKIQTLQHVLEGYKVANEIAAHGAGASTFSDWWAYKVEAFDAIPHNAALMVRKGVLVSINSDSSEEIRHLPAEAAKTIKWGGLSEEEALALVTINPAKQLRIDDRVGSIEVGKDADLALWDGSPLSVYSKTVKTIIDGEVYFDREADRERTREIAEEKALLLSQEKAAREPKKDKKETDE